MRGSSKTTEIVIYLCIIYITWKIQELSFGEPFFWGGGGMYICESFSSSVAVNSLQLLHM